MSRLLSAGFMRLWKSRVFWTLVAGMFLWSLFMVYGNHMECITKGETDDTLTNFFFGYGVIIGGAVSIFTSLFFGTDYSDGTIRNKIIIGHSRQSIYMSNFIISVAAGAVMTAAWILAMLAVGLPVCGWNGFDAVQVLVYLAVSFFMITAFAAVFTAFGMLLSNRSVAVIVSFLVFLFFLWCGAYIYSRLREPEMRYRGPTYTITTEDGVEKITDASYIENPTYVRGTQREIYTRVLEFMPTGQALFLMQNEVTDVSFMIFSSLVITVVVTSGGIVCFGRKDLL